jgi:hypothetical protein
VAIVRTDVSEKDVTSDVSNERISELGTRNTLSVLQIIVTATIAPNSLSFSTLMVEAKGSSEISAIAIAPRRHIPEDWNLHIHRHENLTSFLALTGWAL